MCTHQTYTAPPGSAKSPGALAMSAGASLAVATEMAARRCPQKQHAAAGSNRAMMLATLMPTPRSLHDLWQEYEHGVGGRKAAMFFPILSAVPPSTSITKGKLCGI